MGEESSSGFDQQQFFEMLRKSAWTKTGAILFGQAQGAYYNSLKESGLSEEQAYNMLAHTTEQIIKGIAGALPRMTDVAIRAAAMLDLMGQFQPKDQSSDKQVPGE